MHFITYQYIDISLITATFLLSLHVLNGKATILLLKVPYIMPSTFSSILNISFISFYSSNYY
ncbi:putative membrane protein (plasmid) [Clostridium botulinum]|uniref:Putative membrane protein n=1 Tax=Clostridium botulinum TaxID=1491 RepID=A0A1L7JMN8_CLOBO|nr:putative membrane protein [Clostridium botulinum]